MAVRRGRSRERQRETNCNFPDSREKNKERKKKERMAVYGVARSKRARGEYPARRGLRDGVPGGVRRNPSGNGS